MGTPLLFYLRFGNVDWFAFSCTIFLVVACLLFALGLHFQNKTEYHTKVPMAGSLADRIGALWLVACGLGPFFRLADHMLWYHREQLALAVPGPRVPGGDSAGNNRDPIGALRPREGRFNCCSLAVVGDALPILSCFWVIGDMHDGPQTFRVAVLTDGSDGPRICRDLDREREFTCDEFRPVLKNQRLKITWLAHTRRLLVKENITG